MLDTLSKRAHAKALTVWNGPSAEDPKQRALPKPFLQNDYDPKTFHFQNTRLRRSGYLRKRELPRSD